MVKTWRRKTETKKCFLYLFKMGWQMVLAYYTVCSFNLMKWVQAQNLPERPLQIGNQHYCQLTSKKIYDDNILTNH